MIALVWLLFRLVIVLGALAAIVSAWAGVLSAIAVLILACRRPPRRLRWTDFFRRGRLRLLAIAWLAGAAAQLAVTWMFDAASGQGWGYLAGAAAGVAVAAGCVYWLKLIFEGKAMKSIFSLVPADQQAGLQEFLSGGDPNAAGQAADLSKLDQHVVAAAVKERVVGQDGIVDAVVAQTFRRASLPRPNKPIATLMFVGATGAGKTEMAKALADTLFGGRLVVQRLNQLKSAQDVWSIIGPPPGYQGSAAGGKLCRDIGRAGTGVVLLDEAEKCHPDVMQALMTLLDEGKITEQSTGTVYSARGFVVILTSNSAAGEIAKIAQSQADPTARTRAVKEALESAGWLPEVLGRMDAVFPFPSLDREGVAKVVGLMVMRQAKLVGVDVRAVDAALLIDLIKRQEKVAQFGMRELDRLVETAVLDGMIAAKKGGASSVAIHVRGDAVSVDSIDAASAAAGPNRATA